MDLALRAEQKSRMFAIDYTCSSHLRVSGVKHNDTCHVPILIKVLSWETKENLRCKSNQIVRNVFNEYQASTFLKTFDSVYLEVST